MNDYQCVQQLQIQQNIGTYTTYGICVNGEYTVDDIGVDRQFVERLTALFNRLQLEPIHLLDVLDDLL